MEGRLYENHNVCRIHDIDSSALGMHGLSQKIKKIDQAARSFPGIGHGSSGYRQSDPYTLNDKGSGIDRLLFLLYWA